MIERNVASTQSVEMVWPRNEKLSPLELGNLVAAVGNSESKAAFFAAMHPNHIYTLSDSMRLFKEMQGENPGWQTRGTVSFDYLRTSFSTFGLVSYEVLDEHLKEYGYKKTNFGKDVGDAVAGYLMDYSYRHPQIALTKLFGVSRSNEPFEKGTEATDTTKKRSPYTRINLFWELLTGSLPLRTVDLEKRLGIIHTGGPLSRHLQDLKNMGVIEYESSGTGKPYAEFHLSPDHHVVEDIPIYSTMRNLSVKLYELFLQEPDRVWAYDTLADEYIKLTPERPKNKKYLKTNMSSVLSFFRKNGIIVQENLTGETQSIININEEQRNTLLELMTILDGIQNVDKDFLAEGRKLAQEYTSDKTKIASLLAKAKENSSFANHSPTEDTSRMIKSCLYSNQSCTIPDIQNYLSQQDKNLTIEGIRKILLMLQRSGEVTSLPGHGAYKYWNVV
ncbi:MAG: winged helix-turn-helix domain-containing protein [Patescibacteria group bacterium]